ncbi:MAG: hypothetical protein JO266_22420 [Acidobacteria bacterium]|nr:hypothetical protein [Acidobacteriota bacterium]
MAQKKKPGIFRASKAIKAAARERVGSPPPSQVVDSRKQGRRNEKHRPTLRRLLEEQ